MNTTDSSDPVRHLYVHVPFCTGKCSFCVLYSVFYNESRAARYVDALAHEMDAWLREGPPLQPETIFFGGGTPSSLSDALFERLLGHLTTRMDTSALTEWTIEAQPGTLNARKISAMRAAGVNRVSLGAQALQEDTLQRIFRRHTVADVAETIASIRDGGIENVSIDLIACLPKVSSVEWRQTVTQAAALPLHHASVYALTLEPGSLLTAQADRDEFVLADEDTQIAELAVAEAILGDAGLYRYEFSNYARPGQECRHNLACWRGRDYVGFGPAASSRLGLHRWTNLADVNAYVTAAEAGAPVHRESETLDASADLTERLIFGFRLAEGVDLDHFQTADDDLRTHWQTALSRLTRQGVVEQRGTRWALTPNGRLYADRVAEDLIPA
ncbi:MAG: radical SAM family heme chaperone HemW [Verrucomicrobia bacterium]|nr:radical SAM family heme chaperone HemW [Verrucomicrobiota bacterium]